MRKAIVRLCGSHSDHGRMSPGLLHLVLAGLRGLRGSICMPAPSTVALTSPADVNVDGLSDDLLLGRLRPAARAPAARGGLVVIGWGGDQREQVLDALHLGRRECRGRRRQFQELRHGVYERDAEAGRLGYRLCASGGYTSGATRKRVRGTCRMMVSSVAVRKLNSY